MDILGILAILITPFMAGYVIKEIIRQRETSQIETYLIGFFFLFLLQGIIFSYCVLMGKTYAFACLLMRYVLIITYIISIFIMCVRLFFSRKKINIVMNMKKRELILLFTMIFFFFLLILRVYLISNCLRSDIMIETVRTTASTATMYQFHPLTGQAFENGVITSKKIITLPLYYAFWSSITGLEPNFLLYVVITIQTIAVTFFAATVLIKTIFNDNREKILSFIIILELLILSGDYFAGSVPTKILWNGYSGDIICAVTMIPYLLFCILNYYQTKKIKEKMTFGIRVRYLIKIFLCMIASIFITTISTGLLFLIITVVLAILSCIFVSFREGRKCRK